MTLADFIVLLENADPAFGIDQIVCGDATMKLSLKATRFVIEALEHYQKEHEQRLTQKGLSEDEISDLENDRYFLEAIKKDVEQYRDELAQQREIVNTDA